MVYCVFPCFQWICRLYIERQADASGGHINLGIVSGSITGGAVLSGCADSQLPFVAPPSPACVNLSEPFLSACNFDVAVTNDTSFVASSVAMSKAAVELQAIVNSRNIIFTPSPEPV